MLGKSPVEEIYKNRTDIIKLDGTQNQDTLTHQCYAAVTEWLKKKRLNLISIPT